jgi:hypothetical protein
VFTDHDWILIDNKDGIFSHYDFKETRDIVERFKFTFATIIFLLMFGCTMQFAKDNDISRPYEGHHIDEIIEQWGDPVKSYVAPNGNKVYVYYRADIKTQKDISPGGEYGVYSSVRTYITNVDVCTTYFETSGDGMIVRSSYEGNGCERRGQALLFSF